MAGKFGADFDANKPTDDDAVKWGARWIRDIKARLKTFLGVQFDIETGKLRESSIVSAQIAELSPSPAGDWQAVRVNSRGQVTKGLTAVGGATSTVFPTGGVIWMPVNTTPAGFLICNGTNVSRTTYADLFAIIGTNFGVGDGSSTFALPNLQGRFVFGSNGSHAIGERAGAENITLSSDQIPNHSHGVIAKGATGQIPGPEAAVFLVDPASAPSYPDVTINTETATGGGQPHSNMPPFQAGLWLIKT